MNPIIWIVIGVALLIFLIFAGWPLYGTYRTRRQGADVQEADEYLAAKKEWQHAEAEHQDAPPPAPPGGGGPASDGVTRRSGPAPTPPTTGKPATTRTKQQRARCIVPRRQGTMHRTVVVRVLRDRLGGDPVPQHA